MDLKYSLLPWYTNEQIRNAVNLCLDAIESSGISATDALEIPASLESAIKRSNDFSLSNSKFKPTHIDVEIADGTISLVTRDP